MSVSRFMFRDAKIFKTRKFGGKKLTNKFKRSFNLKILTEITSPHQNHTKMSKAFNRIDTEHDDLIHDLSYDFYGKRLATCSSDQKIKVFDLTEDGTWKLTYEWKAHSGSIWKVAWAHPEFGNVIASCSFDRTVCIWEEEEDNKGDKSWKGRATLVDSRESVTDVKFAPRHQGFKLVGHLQ
jgi:WD40 repeat protein